MNHQEFLKQKPELIKAFQKAIHQTLVEMGEDVKGISWFSSEAEKYNEDKELQNCRAR